MSPAFGKCYDPSGVTWGIPTYPWRLAPDGYATRRQLRARGLRPGGQEPAAQVMRRSRRRKSGVLVAYLYRVDRAKPVRPMTAGKSAALAKAMQARRTCPACQMDAGYVIPTSLGMCVPCAYPQASTLPHEIARPIEGPESGPSSPGTRLSINRTGPTAHLSQRRPGPPSLGRNCQ